MSERTISVTEAHSRFGDLAHIRNGVTHWITVINPEGLWAPKYENGLLVAYELMPRARS